MQIAQVLAGYSLGQADLLRRAMGKKIRAEMDAQRGVFVKGATEREVSQADADAIFDLLQKFADYGFNKSHAAAYALVAYQTAYLKANHPVEFLAASMTMDMGSTDKLAEFRTEAERLGIRVEPPNVNTSGVEFEVHEGAIRYALAAVKGVGAQAAAALVAARGARPFRNLGDFARRIDPKQVNRRTLEQLAQAGAFDDLEPNRAAVVAALDEILAIAGRTQEDADSGQGGLFGAAAPEPIRPRNVQAWTSGDRLTREYEAIGFFLTGHPLDSYAKLLARMKLQRWTEFAASVRQGATAGRLAATVLSRQEKRTKSGNRMGIVKLSDPTGHYEAIIFSEGLAEYRDLLEPNTSVVVSLQASVDGDEVRARIVAVEGLEEAAAKISQSLQIFLRDPAPVEHLSRQLQRGEGDVSLILLVERETEVEVKLPGRWRVSPQIAAAIKSLPGVVDVVSG